MSTALIRRTAALSLVLFAVSCSGGSQNLAAPQRFTPLAGGGSSPISHVVIVIQENRSFDDLFATFPGADGTTMGRAKNGTGYGYIPLKESTLRVRCDLRHSYQPLSERLRRRQDGRL